MSRSARIAAILVVTVAALALVAAYVSAFLLAEPPTVAAATRPAASITLQTVASVGYGPHPNWVSYFAKDASGQWKHSTVLQLPAHSLIHVTIENYDGASGLRNPFFGLPRGISGPMEVNGQPLRALDPSLASHTFAIPDFGVSVPIEGVAGDAGNPCEVAPCSTSFNHKTITFTFRTGAPGVHHWQCFVPCAAGWQYGFGGPMQTFGYMDGLIKVV